VKLSSGVEWALHCCVTLSQAQAPVPAQWLAELHGVPGAYLAKQLQALSRAGVVLAAQGPDGGYSLSRPGARITMLDVVDAIEGGGELYRCTEIRCRGPLAVPPELRPRRCAVYRAMAAAEQAWREALATVTIAELATRIDDDSQGTAMGAIQDWLFER
jgi:Rrf2 family protein